jgi:NitT/TauT family transport system substrate-binding protein
MKTMRASVVLLLLFILAGRAAPAAAADHARIGVVKSTLSAPLYVAVAKGFFTEENIDPEIMFFEAAQPIFVAVVSGDLDFGVSGVTGGFYQLASQGQLRIIAAHSREVPGFNGYGVFVSKPAYNAGLKSLKDIGGHSVGINTVGSSFHYSLALIAEKYGINMKTIAVKPLQQNTAITSALAGGTIDLAIVSNVYGLGPVARGQARVLGWVGDETPWQLGVAAVTPKTADTRSDYVQRFLKAYRKGARLYHDAVTGPDEREHLNAGADEVIAIIAKAIGQTPDEVKPAIAYADPEERLDVKDILHQIDWYKEQGMIKGDVDAGTVIDKRYVIPLPTK